MEQDGDRSGAALVQLPTDRYRIDGELGSGGTATVYWAWDTHAEEWVAVKVMNPALLDQKRLRRRFEIEAIALQKLDHRNIIKVLDSDFSHRQPYIVMELAEGGCLIDWIRQYGPLPPRMAVDAAIQVCKGVAVAHAQGIIHRDIKPHNILMNHRGVCKLTDFGIAQMDAEGLDLTRTGMVMGTLGYIAPEQRTDTSNVDERVDVYAIGATFYTMLTGRVAADLFFAEKDPSLLEGVPDPLHDIILRATAYNPDDRFADVSEMARVLHAIRGELPPTPTETPSLVLRYEEELEPPPRPPAENTYSDIGATPAPAPHYSQDPTLSLPGEPPPSDGVAVRAMLAVGITVMLTMLLAMIGVMAMNTTDARVVQAEQAYYRTLAEHRAIVDDLVLLGADPATPDQLYRAQAEATHPESRRQAAEVYVRYLEQQVEERAAHAKVGDRAVARNARARLEAIKLSQEQKQEAYAAAARRGCGG